MRSVLVALCVVAMVAACSGKKPAPSSVGDPSQRLGASSTPEDKPTSRTETDADGLLVHEKDGVIVRTADGEQLRVVFAGSVEDPAYDPTLELLWFVKDKTLRVVDLRDANAVAIEIATGLPGSSFRVTSKHGIVGNGWGDTYVGGDVPMAIDLQWNDKPAISWDMAAHVKPAPEIVEEADANAAGVDLVGTKWLAVQLDRSPRQLVPAPSGADDRKTVPLPEDIGECDSEGPACGSAERFGTTGWLLVIARATYIGAGWTSAFQCVLYDESTNTFAVPPDTQKWGALDTKRKQLGPCGVYHFDRTGKTFAIGSSVCTLGAACRSLEGKILGWINPGPSVGRKPAEEPPD